MSDGFRRFLPGLALAVFSLACGQAAAPKTEPVQADASAEPVADAAPAVVKPDAAADRSVSAPALAPDGGGSTADLAPAADLGTVAPDAAPAPAAVLLYTRATGYVHASTGAAAMALKNALAPLGVAATISQDPALIATD